MTTPTLGEFAKALDIVRQRYPDAPGLPTDYEFMTDRNGNTQLAHQCVYLPRSAALALCVVAAMDQADHWQRQVPHLRSWRLYETDDGYCFMLDTDDDRACVFKQGYPSRASAALAMLEVIGGQ